MSALQIAAIAVGGYLVVAGAVLVLAIAVIRAGQAEDRLRST